MLSKEREQRVLKQMNEMGIQQMLISDPAAIFYMTGKWIFPGERFLGLLIRQGQVPTLFLNELFQFEEEIGVHIILFSDTDNIMPVLQSAISPSMKLGVDKTLAARFLLAMMENDVASGYINGSLAIDTCRARKDETEQELMRAASRVNDLAMEEFKKLVHAGVTEREIGDQIMGIYKSLGASGFSFDPIVSFGANAADPHHMPDDTVLKEGDCVLFDVGCVVNNYCSDMTRTYFYKTEPTEEQRTVYNLVRRANEEAEDMLQPGIVISTVDQRARDIITEGGYGKYFTHRLGHFIGIEDHEFGDVSLTNQDLEAPGITHSIEPGIYLPGKFGVRIEDLVLITENGHEVLNHLPHDLEVLG